MKKYRLKGVVEAVKWTGVNIAEVSAFTGGDFHIYGDSSIRLDSGDFVHCGEYIVRAGDSLQVFPAEAFEDMYEEVIA